jgi:hypothetical protein
MLTDEEKTTMENLEILVKARTEQLRQAIKENQTLRESLANLQKEKATNA